MQQENVMEVWHFKKTKNTSVHIISITNILEGGMGVCDLEGRVRFKVGRQ